MSSCGLGAHDACEIADGLCANGALIKFDISQNRLYAEGTKLVAQALKNNQVMTDLNLSSNEMTDDGNYGTDLSGVIAIGNAIPTIGAMAKFTFSGYTINGQGPPVTIETSMTKADFSGKKLGPSGAIMLAAFLPKCQ